MRNTIFAVSFVSLLLSAGALGADRQRGPVEDAKPAVTPDTPSGVDTVVCRAPQPIPGSEQLGPQVCLHNSEWWKIAMNGKDVAPDGKSLIAKATVDNPTGEGDPDAVTCRTPNVVAPAKLRLSHGLSRDVGPEICRTNRFWADVIKKRQIVDANGGIVATGFNIEFPSGYNSPYDSGQVQSGQPLPGTP